jgi:hypothetical protein
MQKGSYILRVVFPGDSLCLAGCAFCKQFLPIMRAHNPGPWPTGLYGPHMQLTWRYPTPPMRTPLPQPHVGGGGGARGVGGLGWGIRGWGIRRIWCLHITRNMAPGHSCPQLSSMPVPPCLREPQAPGSLPDEGPRTPQNVDPFPGPPKLCREYLKS